MFRNVTNRLVLVDEPEITRKRILGDIYLTYHYRTIYLLLINIGLSSGPGPIEFAKHLGQKNSILEIGSAGGILKDCFEKVITSDVRSCSGVDRIIDAHVLPFPNESLDLIIGKDALHHLPRVTLHFEEISRVLKKGASAVYFEPNWNLFSKVIYKFAHPEPWRENLKVWDFPSNGPMDSNQALAKLIFTRDRELFKALYPDLKVEIIEFNLNALAFLLSGGVHRRNRINASLLIKINEWEKRNKLWMKIFGLNKIIKVTKL
jgi:SAM-dependent methyltransferase